MFDKFFRSKPTLEEELRQLELRERRRRIGRQLAESGDLDRIVADALIYDPDFHLLDDLNALPEIDESDINRLTP